MQPGLGMGKGEEEGGRGLREGGGRGRRKSEWKLEDGREGNSSCFSHRICLLEY